MPHTAHQRRTAIRPAAPDDCEALALLAGQLGYRSTAAEISGRLGLIAGKNDHAVFVAQDEENRIVGWAHAAVELHLESGMFAEIVGLVVEEGRRGGGAGRALVTAAEQWAVSRGCSDIRVRTNIIREGAHKFYERMGYTLAKQQKVFGKTLKH